MKIKTLLDLIDSITEAHDHMREAGPACGNSDAFCVGFEYLRDALEQSNRLLKEIHKGEKSNDSQLKLFD